MNIKFEKSQAKPSSSSHCTVTEMNGIIELRSIAKKSNALENIVRISGDLYCMRDTGEVFEYSHGQTRAENKAALSKTFRNLRHLINTNFVGALNELLVTLTYVENMTDAKRLYRDVQVFNQRLKRRYPDIQFLIIVEPQGRGAWHCHVLYRFDERESVYIPNDEIAKLWGHGFTKTKRLHNVDDIGAYFTAYLADIPLDVDSLSDEEIETMLDSGEVVVKEVEGEDGQKVKKGIIKGGRLSLYPPGMNLYRKSRGILFPQERQMEYAQAREIVGSREPDYSTAREIYDDDGHFLNAVFYEQYNLRREKKQAQNEEASKDDLASSDRGISDRPAGEGQQPQNPEILQANPECLSSVYWLCEPRQHNPFPMQTVLHPSGGEKYFIDYDTDIPPCPPGVPDLVLP